MAGTFRTFLWVLPLLPAGLDGWRAYHNQAAFRLSDFSGFFGDIAPNTLARLERWSAHEPLARMAGNFVEDLPAPVVMAIPAVIFTALAIRRHLKRNRADSANLAMMDNQHTGLSARLPDRLKGDRKLVKPGKAKKPGPDQASGDSSKSR